ncbi:SHOCT domain-containing protein [Jiangella mangrovi]|uniref:SHOCT domain-containing protein n=1 Tax=Jiangella mangrovi TaxID=1524084 RepID=A0A7W9GS03_9ACTN|nr:SHOCT domain-containing protein [Jiangella mangrovi]MBB5788972.1 hypothetical protein [Jiangella mangrovi]
MGLLRGMARTAVVAGTATAVSNRVSRRQASRWQQQDYDRQMQEQAAYEQQARAAYAAQPPPQPAPSAAGGEDDLSAQLERLADLKAQGVLTDEEFAAAKARLLNG